MLDLINWNSPVPYYVITILCSYLAGSIPFGLILTRLAGLGDIRDLGSGSIGATNALRTGNKWVAVGTLLGDGLKGVAAVVVARNWGPDLAILAAGAAFIGHLYPVWLRFKGGKGVATFTGLVLILHWPAGLLFCVTWLATAAVTRFSSLAGLLAAALTPVYMYYFDEFQISELCLVLAAFIFVRHWENIKRLVKGEEPRIGQK